VSGLGQRFRRRIERELVSNEAWRVRVGRHWLCPYCGEAVADRRGRYAVGDGRELERIVAHLEACPRWERFEGKARPLGELKAKARRLRVVEDARRHLVESPAWQLYDLHRRWYCPYCAQATDVRVPPGDKISAMTLGLICRHLRQCSVYDRGRGAEKPLSYIESMVAWVNRAEKMAEFVRRKITTDAAWRLRDAEGRWVCPHCRTVCEAIDFTSSREMLETAPLAIARHLIAACPGFRRHLQQHGAGGAPGPVAWEMARLGSASTPDMVKLSGRPPEAVSGEWAAVGGPPTAPDDATAPGPGVGAAYAGAQPAGGTHGISNEQPVAPPGFILEEEPEHEPGDDESPALRDREAGPVEAGEGPGDAAGGASPEVPERVGTAEDAGWQDVIDAKLAEVRTSVGALSASPQDGGSSVRLPEVSGLELRAYQRQAGHVAGDFIDVVPLADGRAAFLVGAAAGGGGDAALYVPVARNLVRMHLKRTSSIVEVLTRVNADLCAEGEAGSFVSLLLATVDAARRELVFAKAGASAPLLCSGRRQPKLTALDCGGMALGIDRGDVFTKALEPRTVVLEEGDLLVFHTVGAFTASDTEGRELGHAGLQDLVRRYGRHEADYFITKFAGAFEDWTRGAALREDASVLAVKVR
jgi:hypothetical protein